VVAADSLGRACYYAVVPSKKGHGQGKRGSGESKEKNQPGFTFEEAEAGCQANGTQLVSIHSTAENQFITKTLLGKVHGNYNFWIGLELSRNNGIVDGSSWVDGTPVDYGDPVVNAGQYPWAKGHPDNKPNDNNTQIPVFGKNKEHWVSAPDVRSAKGKLNGYICEGCPAGWTLWNGNCYLAVVDNSVAYPISVWDSVCGLLNATVVSIHSQAENTFVLNLVEAADPSAVDILIGLRLQHSGFLPNDPVTSIYWSDNPSVQLTAADWGGVTNPQGTNPWAPAGVFTAQPDNRPLPGDCTVMWVTGPSGGPLPGLWDDVACATALAPGTVCKFAL